MPFRNDFLFLFRAAAFMIIHFAASDIHFFSLSCRRGIQVRLNRIFVMSSIDFLVWVCLCLCLSLRKTYPLFFKRCISLTMPRILSLSLGWEWITDWSVDNCEGVLKLRMEKLEMDE